MPLFVYSNIDKILYCAIYDRLELVYLGKGLEEFTSPNKKKNNSLKKSTSKNHSSDGLGGKTPSIDFRWEMALREPVA